MLLLTMLEGVFGAEEEVFQLGGQMGAEEIVLSLFETLLYGQERSWFDFFIFFSFEVAPMAPGTPCGGTWGMTSKG